MPIIIAIIILLPSLAMAKPFTVKDVTARTRAGEIPQLRQIKVKVQKRNEWRKERYAKILSDIQKERERKEAIWSAWKLGNILDKLNPYLVGLDSDLNPTLTFNQMFMHFRGKD